MTDTSHSPITEHEAALMIVDAIREAIELSEDSDTLHHSTSRTFEEGGVMNNVGFTLRLRNGDEFQITVVRSR